MQSTYITHDTQLLAAEANEAYVAAGTELAAEAAQYVGLDLPYDVARKLELLRSGLTMPAPPDPAKTTELTRLAVDMEGVYGRGTYCPPEGACLSLEDLTAIGRCSGGPAPRPALRAAGHLP